MPIATINPCTGRTVEKPKVAVGAHFVAGNVLVIRNSSSGGCAARSPAEPADEQAQLQRAYIEAVKHQEALVARMERLAGLASLPPSQLLRV